MRFLEFKTELQLDENQAQYKQMLDFMVSNQMLTASRAEMMVNKLRETLKRKDRIVWFLRWFRIAESYQIVNLIITNPKFEDRKEEFKRLFQKITKVNFDSVRSADVSYFNIRWLKSDTLEHISHSLTIPTVEQFSWDINLSPRQMMDKIKDLEKEYAAKQKQWVGLKEGDKIILNYGKQAWVMLNRGSCDDEADAMGHCGNVPSEREGDRILSFRTIEGEKQKPHLTFILNQQGKLGEMKGRANEKPSAKYHPYIVDLLKQDFIKGVEGGGYAPENNFAITDLSGNLALDVLKKKPQMIPKLHLYDNSKVEVPKEIQDLLVQDDKKWVMLIKNLTPELKLLRKKLTYAIVTEPGLTHLSWRQYLTKKDYDEAVEYYGADTFEVKLVKKQ
jgi:hypothetical protein